MFGIFVKIAYFCSTNSKKKRGRIINAEWKEFYEEAR